ncbi:hypothetical protein MJO28_008235 [Puccinia striiformis f. sp. tritici]|uniref:NIPSNAP domain-containing protein n=5 Tax=Puccinia striiformis TaxID=27350 RepID=A0A0L0V0N0_9BASI|nr:hypothetical protein Pst134EA_015694 [Puccinia striiformis f. sp. tritici]XP_047805457.1 hypothetical protein Pst134EA_015707 [Puccinia striiformis f. sp. tritici]KAI9606422.1 hypothetical protein KEM48_001787 [Puccinia striiformis f. sp. tritici PST-130]KNE92741.1 hypothetical protein PSTG_13872 [Puccinia striiformis f. sp. tritici PST-78]POW13363.1 hypothetical protein PSTT_03817 [Puccinia striiformis]KAH9452846.1 hypothetical protein Pst134EB_016798 [Puccinia striiformis f. sp. tritici]
MSSLLPKLFSRPIPVISTTRRSVSIAAVLAVEPKVPKLLNSLLHGSEEARKQNEAFQSHSTTVGSKTISEVQKHRVLPQHVDQYKEIIGAYFEKLSSQTDLNMTLKGSFEVVVGELDTFVHIWEFDGYKGYDYATSKMRERAEHQEFTKSIRSLVNSRNSQLCREFAFWPCSGPKVNGGIYEMRSYQLKPGTLLEWETEWRRGLEARRKFVEPIGAWFAQVGRLHQVHHMWQYPSLQARLELREKAWQVDTWSNTVSNTVKLCDSMDANVLLPNSFSPLR